MNPSSNTPTPAGDKQADATTPANGMEQKSANAASADQKLHDLAPEIRKQWTKLSDQDLAGVTGQDDLARTVEKAYAISFDDASKQVQSWAQGRQF